ncbi:MAG TPA: hypothetical protein VLV50_14540 [Stellaceae bacterium]|nr:hypothetical protein [Stellaceae bacterium]
MSRALLALAALTAMLVWPGAPARADDMVVVAARGIALAPGTRVDPAKPLVLAQGQHVTLIALNGTTLKLDGPYDKAPALADGGSDLGQALAALVTQNTARTTEAGVTRAAATVAHLPSPWLLDVSRGGSVCLRDGAMPVFWRPTDKAAAHLTVMPADRSWKGEAKWPAGDDELSAPSDLPVHGDAIYFMTIDNGEEAAITVNLIPRTLASTAMQAAWLAHQGCEAQAEALLRQGK